MCTYELISSDSSSCFRSCILMMQNLFYLRFQVYLVNITEPLPKTLKGLGCYLQANACQQTLFCTETLQISGVIPVGIKVTSWAQFAGQSQ